MERSEDFASFLTLCTDLELVAMIKELRTHSEDREYLIAALTELGKRTREKNNGNG